MKLGGKEDWQIAAVASLGLICPWNPSVIEDKIMPYLDNEGKNVKAGASLAVGLCSVGVNDENDLPYALLTQNVSEP